MKQFEKWFDDYLKKIPDKWNRLLAKSMKKLYQFIWKEALKWIRIQCCPEAWDVGDIEDDIDEELGDT